MSVRDGKLTFVNIISSSQPLHKHHFEELPMTTHYRRSVDLSASHTKSEHATNSRRIAPIRALSIEDVSASMDDDAAATVVSAAAVSAVTASAAGRRRPIFSRDVSGEASLSKVRLVLGFSALVRKMFKSWMMIDCGRLCNFDMKSSRKA